MAHHVEPMDIDNIESDFDNKENSIHHSNVYPRTPCTEKGYEELDVSELNMKLRYSITPAASPMSKSYTANCADSRGLELGDDTLNANLTRSLHSAFSKSDVMNKSVKMLPLQTISSDQFVDSNRNTSVLRPLDTTTVLDSNITVTVTHTNDVDENLSCPSSSSSMAQTPEATTPTKDIPLGDGGSPIMRGLKSVLNMFRSSQSPIPPADNADGHKQVLSPAEASVSCAESSSVISEVLASTPIAAYKQKESSILKRSSPLKESITFNEDLEKELLWKDETTILFSQEKIPMHKLFFQQAPSSKDIIKNESEKPKILDNLNSTVEYMDISCNDSFVKNKTITDLHTAVFNANESDAEFVDCETTFTNDKSDIGEQKHHDTDCEPTSIVLAGDLASTQKEVPDERSEKENSVLPQPSTTETMINITADFIHDISNCEEVEDDLLTNANVNKNIENVEKNFGSEDDNKINNVALAGNNGGFDLIYGNLNIKGSTKDTNNVKEEPQPQIETIKEADFNMTNESETASSRDLDLINSYIIDSLTKEISESNILKLDLGATIDIKGNLTYVDKNTSVSLPSKASDTSEITEPVIIEEPTNTVLPSGYNKTVDLKVEDVTFTKEDQSLSLHMNDNSHTTVGAKIEEITFTKDTEFEPMHVNNSNSKCNLEVANTATPAPISFLDTNDLPANVTLPNDSDIGGGNLSTISVEERFSVESTPNNPANTESENIDCVEGMPIKTLVEAKLENENTEINYSISESSFVTNNKGKQSEIIDMNKITEGILESKGMTKGEFEINESLSEEIPMGISESTKVHLVTDVQQAPLVAERMKLSLGSSLEKLVDEHIDIPPTPTQDVLHDAHVTHNDIIQGELTIGPETKGNEVINIAISSEMLEASQTESQPNEPRADKIADTTAIAVDNLQDSKSVGNKIEIESGILIETAVKTEPSLLESNTSEFKNKITTDLILTNRLDVDETSLQIHSTSDDIHEEPPKLNRTSHNEKNDVNVTHNLNEDTIHDINIGNKIQEVVEIHEEEISMSKDHSPFLTIAAQNDPTHEQPLSLEEIEDPFKSKSKVLVTPPASPKIVSKGYNFNFDEIDNPFATKTKIRMSPTPEKPSKEINIFEDTTVPPLKDISKNRRKSQPERKKPAMPKKKINSTFSGSVKTPLAAMKHLSEETKVNFPVVGTENDNRETPECKAEVKLTTPKKAFDISMSIDPILEKSLEVKPLEIEKVSEESSKVPKEQKSIDDRDVDTAFEVNVTEKIEPMMESFSAAFVQSKATSSSEQSTYYSAGTSSGESNVNRNVFNIPEIDDMNFNPFTTKSKMRVSPPPSLNLEFSRKYNSSSNNLTNTSVDDKPVDLGNFNPLVNESEINVSTQPSLELGNKIASPCDNSLNAASTVGKTMEFGYFASKANETFEDKECANVSNLTCSSKATDDKDITVREVHTEDEDTAEGPFLEADDDIDKISDFDGEDVDMMQFSELPPQTFEENQGTGEMFIDAEAFEFLLNQNQSNVVSDSGKESLFLKFDPLFAKRVSTGGVLTTLNRVQKRQSTPKKMSAVVKIDDSFDKAVAGPSALNITDGVDKAVAGPSALNITDGAETKLDAEESTGDFNVTVSKPMMVVSPAVNPVITPRNKTTTPTSSNRRSITFTSPAIAVIDRLLSLSANNSLVSHDSTITHVSREQNEADLALTQLRELLAEKEISVYNLRSESKELKDRLSSLESQMKTLESESDQRLKKVNELNEKLTEKTKINKSMAAVVEEYERTIASLIDETEQDKKRHNEERIQLTKERDEQTAHLASMEVSFSDLHSKYVKSKQIILTCKANEDACKKSIKEFEENFTKMQSNYELLKQHATSKLNHANQELEKMNRAHEAEVLKLNAMIKRKDLHITSLEETLAQKTKANEELTAICDELINKVG